jgi:hypothetical protein
MLLVCIQSLPDRPHHHVKIAGVLCPARAGGGGRAAEVSAELRSPVPPFQDRLPGSPDKPGGVHQTKLPLLCCTSFPVSWHSSKKAAVDCHAHHEHPGGAAGGGADDEAPGTARGLQHPLLRLQDPRFQGSHHTHHPGKPRMGYISTCLSTRIAWQTERCLGMALFTAYVLSCPCSLPTSTTLSV